MKNHNEKLESHIIGT